ncbi:hypothetical protein LBMAG42_09500 [Deltaproteobacteria bacterium]|nr:hypothetical protein LBMAG42_09500 [Deltaproteobacteria bacterium]
MTIERAHPGWGLTRVLLGFAVLAEWLPRGPTVPERYSTAGALFGSGPLPIPRWHPFSPTEAWVLFGVTLAGALLLITGRANRTALVAILIASSALLLHEWINTKAHDRLLFWELGILLFAPGGGRGDLPTTHHAQTALRILFCGIYGATGFNKLLTESEWLTGEALGWHLLTPNFANTPLDQWLSTHTLVLTVFGWFTMLFECSFPFLIWFGRPRVPLLAAGVALHLGIHALMNVGGFAWIAMASYPAMLAPEQVERFTAPFLAFWKQRMRFGRATG